MNYFNNICLCKFFSYFQSTKTVDLVDRSNIPDELWENHILKDLDPVSIIQTSMVSKQLYVVSNKKWIWEAMVKRIDFKLGIEPDLKNELVSLYGIGEKYQKESIEYRIALKFGLAIWGMFKEGCSDDKYLKLCCIEKIEYNALEIELVASRKVNKLAVNIILYRDIVMWAFEEKLTKLELEDIPKSLVNYIDRIIAGETCGLYTGEGQDEDDSLAITLSRDDDESRECGFK